MSRLWRLAGCLVAVFCLSLAVSAVTAVAAVDQPERRALRVGLEDYYPPFAFTDEQGQHTGFDRDMAVALCAQMNTPCEFIVLPMEGLLAGVRSGELDMVVDGLAATEERKKDMEFTDVYYRSRTIYIGSPSITISEEGLTGKRVGAQNGTMQETYARGKWGGVAEIVTGSYDAMLTMLADGRLDVALVDGLPGYEFLKTERGAAFDVLGEPLMPDDVLSRAHIAVRKNAGELRENINKALIAIRLSGEYDRVNRKYFPFSIY